jgi:UDP:flavonoid glycosyltransferase YjiC (YdhE family)
MLAVARVLSDSGESVRFSSSGDAVNLVRKSGYPCETLPLVDVTWHEEGRFAALDTARDFPMILARFVHQVKIEAGLISSFAPYAVISDSMLSTVLASRMNGVKVVTVLNQLRLESSSLTPQTIAKLISAGSISLVDSLWDLSDEILLADLPPPYTISERNLWSSGRAARRAKYVGFATSPVQSLEDPVTRVLARENRPVIYWQVSGPPGTRAPLLRRAQEFADATKDEFVSVISKGNPAGSRVPAKTSFGWFYEWCEVKDTLQRLATVVVSRAGHSSIAQYIEGEKPSLLVPIPMQSEQEGNAAKAERLGISVRLDQRVLNLQLYEDAIARLRQNEVSRKLKEIGAYARNFDATSEIAKSSAEQ